MDWAHILVIILSAFLALFLIAAIVLVIALIKVTRQIQKVTESAQLTMANVEKAVSRVSNLTSANFVIRTIMKQFSKDKGRK